VTSFSCLLHKILTKIPHFKLYKNNF